jgi:small subunit ribosomal protein S8e
MAISQLRSKKKATGGVYHKRRKQKQYELGNPHNFIKFGPVKRKKVRIMGGNTKEILLSVNIINVADEKGKSKTVKISKVKENPANRNFVIRNIITKGTIVETEIGDVVVSSRPGQQGSLNGKLIKKA